MMQQQQQMMMQQEEQQRQQQIQLQQQQQMQTQQTQQIQQTQHIQQTQQTQQTQSSTLERIAKQGGFSYGAIPTKGSQPQPQAQQQPALPPMSSTSLSSQSQSSQSQHMSSVQQSSTSFSHQQSSNEMFESQEFNGGVMKGYKRKDDMSSNEMRVTNTNGRDSAIFGGINGDANSFVADECDYKKHTVKDLANHFALVKPKQNIPHNILPEQRMFNGDQAPQLNYLGANEA